MHAVSFGISGVRRGGKEVACFGFVLLMMKGWKEEEKAQEVIVLPFRLRKREPAASVIMIKHRAKVSGRFGDKNIGINTDNPGTFVGWEELCFYGHPKDSILPPSPDGRGFPSGSFVDAQTAEAAVHLQLQQ